MEQSGQTVKNAAYYILHGKTGVCYQGPFWRVKENGSVGSSLQFLYTTKCKHHVDSNTTITFFDKEGHVLCTQNFTDIATSPRESVAQCLQVALFQLDSQIMYYIKRIDVFMEDQTYVMTGFDEADKALCQIRCSTWDEKEFNRKKMYLVSQVDFSSISFADIDFLNKAHQ